MMSISGCYLPQRYILGVMVSLGVVNAFSLRVCFTISITEMVRPSPAKETNDFNECPGGVYNETNTVVDEEIFDWDEETQGLLLGSFYWGYLLTQVLGGTIAERFGGKYTLGLGILSTAILSVLSPVVIRSFGWQGFVVVRTIEGLLEGTTFPAVAVLLAHWIPIWERASIGSFVFSGAMMGTVFGTYVSGVIIAHTRTWSIVFYFFGVVAIIWFILFCFLCYGTPYDHPFITQKELEYLKKEIGEEKKYVPVPWKAVFSSLPVWALIFAYVGHDYGFYTLLSTLPKYMKNVLKFDIESNALWLSVPYICLWITSFGFGLICDWLMRKRLISLTNIRKVMNAVGCLGNGAFIMAASYAGCDTDLFVVFLTLSMIMMAGFYPGIRVNCLDLSPTYSGTLMGIVNGIGSTCGAIAPYLAAVIAPDQTLLQWRRIFWIILGFYTFSVVAFTIGGSGEVQDFDDVKAMKEKKKSAATPS